jgi:hypothetical protein
MEGTGYWFTPQQRAERWGCWKNGQCVADIARALERRNKSGVYRIWLSMAVLLRSRIGELRER